MTDFPWGDLEPHDFGRGLLQLLRLALADGDEAGDAFARALEGLEIMGMQGISLTPDVIEDATRLIEELQGGVSASPPDLNSEWVSWCLSAACTILQGGGRGVVPTKRKFYSFALAATCLKGFALAAEFASGELWAETPPLPRKSSTDRQEVT